MGVYDLSAAMAAGDIRLRRVKLCPVGTVISHRGYIARCRGRLSVGSNPLKQKSTSDEVLLERAMGFYPPTGP